MMTTIMSEVVVLALPVSLSLSLSLSHLETTTLAEQIN